MSSIVHVSNLVQTFSRSRRGAGFGAALRGIVRRDVERVEAVAEVSFDIARGERVAFIGPNGAGKSTTIKVLTGILHPTSGAVSVLGLVPWKQRRVLAGRIGCVFGQRSQLWYHLPVVETFKLLVRIYDLDRRRAGARLADLAERFDLADLLDRPVRKLSLGQRMRCELAASLLHEPEVVFLDEPTIGLDVTARSRIRQLLVRLAERDGVTVFLTSHDTGDIEQVCERVLFIDGGRLVLDTTVDGLRREHLREKRVEAVIEEESLVVDLPGVTALPAPPRRVVLSVDTSVVPLQRVVRLLFESVRVRDLTVTDPTLDRVIEALHGGGT